MIVELTPGTQARGGDRPRQGRIPITQTLPNVNTDEFLAALDGDTRDYLKLLVAGGGEALGGNGKNLSATFRRFEPTNRDIEKITKALAVRRDNIARSIHNFKQLMAAVGDKDQQLAELVDASNAVFKSFANQDARPARDAEPAARHAADDRHGARQGRQARQRPRARRSASCAPAPARSARR